MHHPRLDGGGGVGETGGGAALLPLRTAGAGKPLQLMSSHMGLCVCKNLRKGSGIEEGRGAL